MPCRLPSLREELSDVNRVDEDNPDMDKTLMDLLETREGTAAAAARAVGVSRARWHKWRVDAFTEDGQLRCWLALRPDGLRLLKLFYARRALDAAQAAA